jgi:hypothetical protein
MRTFFFGLLMAYSLAVCADDSITITREQHERLRQRYVELQRQLEALKARPVCSVRELQDELIDKEHQRIELQRKFDALWSRSHS